MRKYLYLILGIVSVLNVVYSFFSEATQGDFFGIEVNIWVYRLIWFLLIGYFFKTYMNLREQSIEK